MRNSNAIRELMVADRDSECMLRHESTFVSGSSGRLIERLANERGDSVATLHALQEKASPATDSGSWTELGREAARSFRVFAGGRHTGDAVAACRRSIRRTEEAYDRAMALNWPKATLDLLLRQQSAVRRASRELIEIQF